MFAALFGAVAMTGVLALGVNAIMKGPIATMGEVSRKNIAENNMVASTRLAIMMATSTQAGGGDCDADGYIEPIPYRNAGTSPKPTGGGYLPSSIGASMIDPWQTEYGYCAWDHGDKTTTDNVVACGGSTARRLKGAPKSTQIAIAVISAGKDKTFQTSCNAFVDANADGTPDTPLLNKPAGSDDIVLGYTYAEAGKIGGSLWNIKTGEPGTAEIGNRDIEIKGSDGTTAARIGYDAGLDLAGVGDFGAVKSDQVYSKSGSGPINLNGLVRAQKVPGLPAPIGFTSGGTPTPPSPSDCTLPDGSTLASGQSKTMYSETTSTNCAGISQSRTCTNGTLSGSTAYQYSECNAINYNYAWVNSTWSSCSASCGGGTRTRTVTCQREDGTTAADSNCTATKPATSEACNTSSCYTYSWYTGSYGSCSASCGGGTRSRTVYCQRSDGSSVSDSYCSGGKPSTSGSCNTHSCCSGGGSCTPHSSGVCAGSCGGHYQGSTYCASTWSSTSCPSGCSKVMQGSYRFTCQ
ncbi:MAG: hypothetical protein DI626_11630 [Micavibrio aeruginosavorus]|uniref:Uncharacterized protein n=1 Tax=Micavibrio aeruginosavorus TaxID=349221 RepID=A0A2W4ZA97_9BACT|nr:MAG: hypothetical protein DI626_11630 [Micavibrio aeruginosavorus]